MTAGPIIFGLCALLFLALGYLIGVRRRLELLAGYSPERVRDKSGLAHWAGWGVALLGLWSLAAAVALLTAPGTDSAVAPAWAAGIVFGTVALVVGSRRFGP